jgi:two-component system, LuxR family, sensor kinase FixL
LSNAQAALRFLARDPPDVMEIRSILGEIADADKRAGLLIHHLRLLMKRGEEEFVRLDLNQLISEVLNLLHSEFVTRDIEVRASLSPDLPPVNGDRVQIHQLLLNLVSNACEAMKGQTLGAKRLNVTTIHGCDGTVQVVVSDTGLGIARDQLDRIFEPFFTTKENGLGLGLAISRKIARAHGGNLVAEYRDAAGATLRIVLPDARSAQRKAA